MQHKGVGVVNGVIELLVTRDATVNKPADERNGRVLAGRNGSPQKKKKKRKREERLRATGQ